MENRLFSINDGNRKVREIFCGTGETTENGRQTIMMAVDGVYRNGRCIENESDFMIPNDHVMELKTRNRKIIFGASVHPYRGHREMLTETRRCLKAGAAFFSWIPSIQKIDVEDERCIPFYVCLATEGIPFVCYMGSGNSPDNANGNSGTYLDPRRLGTALDVGLSVVIANYPMLGNAEPDIREEKIIFEGLLEMLKLSAEREWNLYADISPYCREGMRDFYERIAACLRNGEIDPKQLVYGSSLSVLSGDRENLSGTLISGDIMSMSNNEDRSEKKLKKILIVDDEELIQGLMNRLLSGDGNKVIICGNLEEAKEACSRHRFDLVITDLRLSGKDSTEGFEIISHVKTFCPDAKVLLMTGNRESGVHEEALRRGALYCVDKPFDILEMARKVKSFGIPVPEIRNRGIF